MTGKDNIVVRPANAADASAFDQIHDAPGTSDWLTLRSAMSQSLLALTSEGAPVGFIEAHSAGEDVEVIMIATRPSARRTGVASYLLQQLLTNARTSGARRVILDVAEDNGPALALYDNMKFKQIARRVGYYRATPDGAPPAGPRDALLLAHHFASAAAADIGATA